MSCPGVLYFGSWGGVVIREVEDCLGDGVNSWWSGGCCVIVRWCFGWG